MAKDNIFNTDSSILHSMKINVIWKVSKIHNFKNSYIILFFKTYEVQFLKTFSSSLFPLASPPCQVLHNTICRTQNKKTLLSRNINKINNYSFNLDGLMTFFLWKSKHKNKYKYRQKVGKQQQILKSG